jgi:hypothetical protein
MSAELTSLTVPRKEFHTLVSSPEWESKRNLGFRKSKVIYERQHRDGKIVLEE